MQTDKHGFPILSQPEEGYRYSIDALLLAGFASRFNAHEWCDLGTGCGIVAYLLARIFPTSRGWAIERQAGLAAHAERNLASCPVELIQGDIRAFPWHDHQFDLLVCNPPYYEAHSGLLNRHPVAAQARHCLHGNLWSFLEHASRGIHPTGVFCFILPVRIWEALSSPWSCPPWAVAATLTIQPFADQKPNLICVALSPSAQASAVSEHLVLYAHHRQFSAEAEAFFAVLIDACRANGS